MSDMNDRELREANANAALCAALHTMVENGFITKEKAEEFKNNYSLFTIRKGGIKEYLRKKFFRIDAKDDDSKFICVKLPKYEEHEN